MVAAIVLITGIAVIAHGSGRFGTSPPFPHPTAALAPTTVVPTPAVLTVPPASKDNGIAIGAWQVGLPWDFIALDRLERDAQHHLAIVALWRCWGGSNSTLDPTWLSAINARGSVPMITWSPQNWDPGTDQAPFSLDNIANGTNDAYIRSFAHIIKNYGGPVLLRPMHEMNGNWYPMGQRWCVYREKRRSGKVHRGMAAHSRSIRSRRGVECAVGVVTECLLRVLLDRRRESMVSGRCVRGLGCAGWIQQSAVRLEDVQGKI